ncbi:MAG TPA: hypothetical protein VNS32_07280 [Flavisolibacter sp.]|nr:hypothetical protein [Flavisolibacter sp.]
MKQNKGKTEFVGCLILFGVGSLIIILVNAGIRNSSLDPQVGKYLSAGIVRAFILCVILYISVTLFLKD